MDFDELLSKSKFIEVSLDTLGQTLIYQKGTPREVKFKAVLDTIKTVDAGGVFIQTPVMYLDDYVIESIGLTTDNLLNKVFYYPFANKYFKVLQVSSKGINRRMLTIAEVRNANDAKTTRVLNGKN